MLGDSSLSQTERKESTSGDSSLIQTDKSQWSMRPQEVTPRVCQCASPDREVASHINYV